MEKKIHFIFQKFFPCRKYAEFGNIFCLTRLIPKLLMKYRESLGHLSFFFGKFPSSPTIKKVSHQLNSLAELNFLVISHTCKSCACPRPWALPKHLYLTWPSPSCRQGIKPFHYKHFHVSRTSHPTQIYPEHGQTGHQYLLLKLTHFSAKMFNSFWCCFSSEFSDTVQPSFRTFAKSSTYAHFRPSPCSSSVVFY